MLKSRKTGGDIHIAHASILSTRACLRAVRPSSMCWKMLKLLHSCVVQSDRVIDRRNICEMCLFRIVYRDFFVSRLLLSVSCVAALATSISDVRNISHSISSIGIVEHCHQTLINSSPRLASLLEQEQDHCVLNQSSEHEEDTNNKIEVNSIETGGYWRLFPAITKLGSAVTEKKFETFQHPLNSLPTKSFPLHFLYQSTLYVVAK